MTQHVGGPPDPQHPQHRRVRKQRQPGPVEKTCDTCSRVDDWIGCATCGCSGSSFLLWLLPASTVTAPRPRSSLTAPGRVGLVAIRAYQRGVSAHTPARCRYVPTCSEYGAQAVQRYGLAAGSRLIAARIRRCTSDVPRGTHDALA